MSSTVYLTATEVGLVKWDEFKKPPYTQQEYEQAYNNGIRMTQAFNDAYINGASKVVLERGNYPVCYVNDSRYVSYITPEFVIEGTSNFEIDGNSSCVFVIFDSDNRSPYHTGVGAEVLQPYQLSGCIFGLRDNTDLHLHSFNLRGDQYNRAFTNPDEGGKIEQTYGILFLENNVRTSIDVVAHGFRGDGVSSKGMRYNHPTDITENWTKGGLDPTTGVESVSYGSYKSIRVDLLGFPDSFEIKRNAIQIVSLGGIKVLPFREDRLEVFFYDENQEYISNQRVVQSEYIYLPNGCRYVQFVTFDDERTDDVVTYEKYVRLATGNCDFAHIKGEYYANNRGGLSNLPNNTTVEAHIHDNGTLKYGFPYYNSTTRYGINCEDTTITKLTVKNSLITNGGSGILCNARALHVSNTEIRNMLFTGIGTYSTLEVMITNNVVANVDKAVSVTNHIGLPYLKMVTISNNLFKRCQIFEDFSKVDGLFYSLTNNKFYGGGVTITGNGNNVECCGNSFHQLRRLAVNKPFYIVDALRVQDNTAVIDELDDTISSNSNFAVSSKISSNNNVISPLSIQYVLGFKTGNNISLTGFNYDNIGKALLYLQATRIADGEAVCNILVDNCNFNDSSITIGEIGGGNINEMNVRVSNSSFNYTRGGGGVVGLCMLRDPIRKEGKKHKIVFESCVFRVKNSADTSVYPASKTDIDITFINCTFINEGDTAKDIPISVYSSENRPHTKVVAHECSYIGYDLSWRS